MQTKEKGITLVALIVTIIILLILSGIAIATLGGENGLFARVKQAKKAHIQSEMQEQLTLALNGLQIDKNGSASLDDVTQDWINTVISSDYNPTIKEDASLNGKLVVMNKSNITGKFLIGQNLEISSSEYNLSSLEFEYETEKIENGKVKILIKITDKVNGLKQVDYPGTDEKPLIMENRKTPLGIDYYVELGKEYKFIITTGDGNKTEKTIKIDDYYYNVTKTLAENAVIDNNATKVAYNKTYEATITTEGNYAITSLIVTMGGQAVTTSENNIVDITTGKIKIEKVTGDIDIKVTTKELKIQYSAVAVSTSSSASNTSSLGANTQNKGTTLYINIIATLEGNRCTAVLKSDNSKTVPYAVNSNGKYTFKVSGTYNGKTVEEDKEVTVNQYMSAKNIVQYDAGDWTKEEIEELQGQSLYNINKEKVANTTVGLNFTFGGFTYKDDKANKTDIDSKNIITSRNDSVTPEFGRGAPKYSGWQILESKEENGRTYVSKITHAGSPENFVYYYTTSYDNRRVEYLLSSGKRQTDYSKFSNGTAIKPRSWQMYVDKNQKDLIADTTDKDGKQIKDVHAMDYSEALAITGSTSNTTGLRNTRAYYWLASAIPSNILDVWFVNGNGGIGCIRGDCWGVRPVVSLTSGVYVKSGTGTEADPYILGKE